MTGKAVGIDLGTTYSCVGIMKHKQVEIIPNAQGNRTTPSYVGFTDTERLIGEEAKNQAFINPLNTVFDAKRLIGRKFDHPDVQSDMKFWPFKIHSEEGRPLVEVQWNGESKKFSAEEISSMVLVKMKETAEAHLGRAVTDAVVSVPAYFNDSQRQAIKDAAKISRLNLLGLINEPTAVAITYGWETLRFIEERNVAVLDMGASNIQVSILKMGNHEFEVLSTSCESHLDKDFWDRMLIEDLSLTIKSALQLAMDSSGLEVAQVHDIVLAGGYSRMEQVQQIIRRYFADALVVDEENIQLNTTLNPDEAVAHGAALLASILSADPQGRRPQDVSALKLSTELGDDENSNRSLIERNKRIPTGPIGREFKPEQDSDNSVRVKVFESEGDMTMEKTLTREYQLTAVEGGPQWCYRRIIKVDFSVDADGMVDVQDTEDPLTEIHISTTNDGDRLPTDEIERMENEAEKYKLEEQMRAKDELLSFALDMNRIASDERLEGKISDSDRETVKSKCDEVIQWLDGNQTAQKFEYKHKRDELELVCSRMMLEWEKLD